MGKPHLERIHGGAWFIGGKPESGKSSLGLIVAAHTALDPGAQLIIVNLKGSPDYLPLKPVCHQYISTTPERDPQVIAQVTALVQGLLDEAARRAAFFTKLVEQGKATGTAVTEELSRKYKQLRAMTVILDEIHRMFDPTDNPHHKEFAELLGKVLKAVRFVAISVVGITQLAGSESIPGVVTRASRVRACLRVSESVSFRQIFGDAGQGIFSNLGIARFPQGTALMSAEDGTPTKVGAWYLTPALPEIGRRALALRQDLRALTAKPPETRSRSRPPTRATCSGTCSTSSPPRPQRGGRPTPRSRGSVSWRRSWRPGTRSTRVGLTDGWLPSYEPATSSPAA
jgi:hypothetical protein